MITGCVIDASVAVKWVITEDGTEAALHLRQQGISFHAPELLVPETGNILWKKVKRRELSRDEAEIAAGTLSLSGITLHSMQALSLAALQIAVDIDHPVYDATYLALAQSLALPLITADRRLVTKLAEMRRGTLPVVNLLT